MRAEDEDKEAKKIKAREFYEEMYARHEVRAGVEFITPERAKADLAERNKNNRNMGRLGADKLKETILSCEFMLNGESVIYDEDGELLDGQHRLEAIAKSEVGVPLVVVYGVKREAFSTIDGGKNRKGRDILDIAGIENSSAVAAAATWMIRHEIGEYNQGRKSSPMITNERILQKAREYPGLVKSASYVRTTRYKGSPVTQSWVVWLHYVLGRLDTEERDTFFEQLLEGIGVEKDSPADVLRKQFARLKQSKFDLNESEQIAWVWKAWCDFRRGKTHKNYRFDSDKEQFPEIPFPEAETGAAETETKECPSE